MENYGANGRDASHPSGRQNQSQPPRPPGIAHNPHQGPLPHMFGNFNAPPNNGYPQINMPVQMPQALGQQANPNMPGMQRPYPPAPYPNPPGPPAASAPPGAYPPGRPREWETPDQRAAIERESKRPRPFQPGPNDSSFQNQQPPGFHRNPQAGMPPHQHSQGPPGLGPHAPQMPRMPPTNAPAIHPPSHPFVRPNTFTPQVPLPPRGPPMQQQDNYQYPPKPAGQFPGQPPVSQSASFDSLPGPPRKEGPSRPVQNQGPPVGSTPADAKPDAKERLENPISFKDFLLKQPDSISPQDAKEKYDQYVREFTRRKPNKFFDLHKDKEWFKERYDPDYVLARAARIKEEVRARAGDYKELWDKGGSGICAPDISSASLDRKHQKPGQRGDLPKLDAEEKKSPGSQKIKIDPNEQSKEKPDSNKKEATTSRQNTDSEAVDDAKQDTKGAESGEKSENVTVDEEKAVLESKGDDSLVVAIKPNAESQEPKMLEDIAQGEGEIAEQETGEVRRETKKQEAATAEQGHDNATDHTRTVEKSESLSEQGKDVLRGAHGDVRTDLVLPLRREHQKHTIFMRGIPINLNRNDLTAVLAHGPSGDMDLMLRRLKIGDINPIRGLERFAWAVYASEEAAAIALEKVRGVVVRSEPSKQRDPEEKRGPEGEEAPDGEGAECAYEIDCMLNLQRKKKYTQGRVLPSIFGTPERMAFDVKQAVKMLRYLDSLRQIPESLNPLTDELLQSLPSDEIRLDHVVTYLREVHYFCYYSGNEFLEDSTSMPPQELRPCADRLSKPMSENDFRVVKRVDERAKWVLERDYDRPRSNSDSAEPAKKAAVQEWLEANTKNEGQGRYRCGLPPNKLFKGPEFVHKHLRTKHGDKMQVVQEKAYLETYRANFENDPSKDEVISIYNDGLASLQQKAGGGRQGPNRPTGQGQGFGFPQGQGRPGGPVGMYNAAGGFMGMGMQPFPMMMMPTAPGYPAAYSAAGGYPNTMNLAGRGLPGAMGGQGMASSNMMPMGVKGVDPGPPQSRPNPRGREGSRDYRDGGYRGGGYRDRGGRRGGHVRRGGDQYRRNDGRPLDPRASGPRRTYNDLDAPANGPSFDLVRYEDV